MKPRDVKLALVHLEVGSRMQIAELAAQLVQMTGATDMVSYFEIYNELCNKILEPLIDIKDLEYVVPQMPPHTI